MTEWDGTVAEVKQHWKRAGRAERISAKRLMYESSTTASSFILEHSLQLRKAGDLLCRDIVMSQY